MRLVYVIGEPGVGKSATTSLALGAGKPRQWVGDVRLSLVDHDNGWIHLGTHRTHFGGVSSLQSKDALDIVCKWVECERPDRFVGEGNKLIRNDRLFEYVLAHGYDLTIVHLQAPRAIASERRAKRGESITQQTLKKYGDPNPDAGWVKIVVSNVARITKTWGAYITPLDADRPLHMVAADLSMLLENNT